MTTITPQLPGVAAQGINADRTQGAGRNAATAETTMRPATVPGAGADVLALSNAVETAMQEAEFDRNKVEQLRAAIAEGGYPVDPMKIADSFIDLERLL